MSGQFMEGFNKTVNFTKITQIRRIHKKRCQDSSWRALNKTAHFTKIVIMA